MSENSWGGARKGAGRTPIKESDKKKGVKIYITDTLKNDILEYGNGSSFSDKALDIIITEIYKRKNEESTTI